MKAEDTRAPERTFFTCEVCGTDRAIGTRRLYWIRLADGSVQRNWATTSSDTTHVLCAECLTQYVWNSTLQVYEKVRRTHPIDQLS